jgi:hypothetical protein
VASLGEHLAHSATARELYTSGLDPALAGRAWKQSLTAAERAVHDTLVATQGLTNIVSALREGGRHVEVLRYLMGPPLSQDQFRLVCPEWSKTSEKDDRPLTETAANAVAAAFQARRDRQRTDSILAGGADADVARAIAATASMIAMRAYQTERRNFLSAAQESAVTDALDGLRLQRLASVRIDEPGVLTQGSYMHKTLFATADGSAHEVDVAVGLKQGRILALECKVSNDGTNSIKRANDVLKKAKAWKDQWGELVRTGAMLEGVYNQNEIKRLLEAGVELFWSHALGEFVEWVRGRV